MRGSPVGRAMGELPAKSCSHVMGQSENSSGMSQPLAWQEQSCGSQATEQDLPPSL